jgi:hypothetical protein
MLGHNDHYHITFPDLMIRGMLTGQMFLELSGTTRITSDSGIVCTIEYVPKPWYAFDNFLV